MRQQCVADAEDNGTRELVGVALRLLHHSHGLTIRGDSYRLRAKRRSGLIEPPAADGAPVGSASLYAASGGANLQPTS